MKKKIHVVPHTHWDREWYFTTSRSKVYLWNNLKKIIQVLQQDEKFNYYMLDAQASLLDDYLAWAPEDEEIIKDLVKQKRLLIGPWYTQSDQLVISAESIVRNLYYGMKRCDELGGYMNIAYVPDSFGQAGNMPQIYRSFGMEDTLFWRGVSDDMVKHTDYYWRGDDDSVVFTTQIPFGYYIGGNIPEDIVDSKKFWEEECIGKAGSFSSTRHIYFPNGFDQAPIRTNLPEIIEKRNQEDPNNEYVISCIEDYIKDVKSENPTLDEVQGELVIAKHMRIHKTIFSSRSDLKILNTEIQNYVTNILEPLLTLSYQLGNIYPHKAVEQIWKLLFENAAHDSIGSCISDTANEDVYLRYKQARDMSENLVELHERLISTKIEQKGIMTLTTFNTLPNERQETIVFEGLIPHENFIIKDVTGNVVPYFIIEKKEVTKYVLSQTIRLNPSKDMYIPKGVYQAKVAIYTNGPAMGYQQYYLEATATKAIEKETLKSLENEYYQVMINDNGSLNILDKQNNYMYKNQAIIVEDGDDGDSFNYSPPRDDFQVSSINAKATVSIMGTEILQKADIHTTLMIPGNLEDRKNQICNTKLPVDLEVVLKKGAPRIEFTLHVKNAGLSHRLRVVFDADMETTHNYADQQFGSICRPNTYVEEMEAYNKSLETRTESKEVTPLANWHNNLSSWQEPPIAIEPTQSYVALKNKERGIAIFPQGVREYEIIGKRKNNIALTMYRTYGYMGKENLLYRPGRASGETIIETPDAQLLKPLTMTFAFTSFGNKENLGVEAKKYNTPMHMYQYADFLNGRIIFAQEDQEPVHSSAYSLCKTEGNLVVSAIKKAEDDKGYIIRLYNSQYKMDIGDTLTFTKPIKKAYYTNLKEEKIDSITYQGNGIDIQPIGHCKCITIYIEI